MSICTICPELTANYDNWCEECVANKEMRKFKERQETYRKALKPLMKDLKMTDPNWEDFAHPYDMC